MPFTKRLLSVLVAIVSVLAASEIRSDEVRGAHFLTTLGAVPFTTATVGLVDKSKLVCTGGVPGTCILYDDTAMTGISGFTVRAGDNQGANYLFSLTSAGGTALGGINADNTIYRLGGITAAFPALKRSAADLQVRLADDTLYTYADVLGVKIGGAGTASRYLKGNATAFVISTGAASGTGACGAGNFVNALNDDAAPSCAVPAGAGGYTTIDDEGGALAQRATLNFIGAGVTCVDNGGAVRTDCTIPGGAAVGYQTIQDEGGGLVQRATVNFIGAGVTCIDNPGTVTSDCTIPGFLPGGGITSINALIPAAQLLVAGNAGVDFNIASAVATHTFNLPDAGPAARGAVTTAAQTFAGKKTFTPVVNFSGLNVGALAGDPAVPANGDLLYNSTANKFRCYENGAWVNCVGAGAGNLTFTGTYAALPAPGAVASGDLYMPSNSPYLLRSTGAAWTRWAFGFQLTEPVLGGFAWINQGGATADVTNGGIYLNAPAVAGDNMRILKVAAPAPPYVVTAAFIFNVAFANFAQCGILFRESGTQELHTWELIHDGASDTDLRISSYKMTNPTTASAAYAGGTYDVILFGPLVWLRIADDGANRICSYSVDGVHWQQYHSIGRADFLTADEIGFYASSVNATYPAGIWLLHWSIT